tara:strand:- start:68 stop:634 length:567 start_codon:yes stop_codon:yes gene_type:complete
MSMYKFKFENGDVIEMKAIKHSEFASEETHCYQAKIYLNGKAWIEVDNEGRGGADRQSPIDIKQAGRWDKIKDINERLKVEHAPEIYKYEGERGIETHTMQIDLENWCGVQLEKFLTSRDLKRLMRTKLIFVKNKKDSTYMSIRKRNSLEDTAELQRANESFLKTYPKGILFNALPFEDAVKAFMDIK